MENEVARAGSSVTVLVPTKSDAEVAGAIRTDVLEKLEALCKTINQAKSDGFVVGFQFSEDGLGRQFIGKLVIAKHF
jgi:hypothetical protein